MNAKVGQGRGTLQQVAGPGRRVAVLPDGPAWRLHLALLEAQASARAGEPAARLHHQRAQLLEQELADPLRAAQAWDAALAADPDYAPARLAARHHALALADDTRLAARLDAGAADDEDRAFHAAVWAMRWPEPARVVQALAEASPGHAEAEALAVLALPCPARRVWLEARQAHLSPAGLEVLAAARLGAGQPAGVPLLDLAAARPLAAWLAVEQAADQDATAQAQALAALAAHAEGPTAGALWFLVAERLPPPADAAYARASGGRLDDVVALQRVLRAAPGPARAQALAACRVDDPTVQAVLAARLALAHEESGDTERAWHAAQHAWRLQPAVAAHHLARAALRHGALPDWAALIADGPPPATATDRFIRAALFEHGLRDRAAARGALGAPDTLGGALPALRAAQRLAADGDCRALQVEARGAPEGRQADLYLQVARAYLTQPDGLDKALTYLFWVLDAEPEHPTALRLAVQACQAAGRIGPLAEVLARWLVIVRAPEDRVPALRAMADLFERTGQPPGDAADLLAEALELQPDAPGLMADLERTLAAAGRAEALADLYRRRVRAAPDGPSKASLGLRLGLLLESRLGDPAAALEAYGAALAAGPAGDVRARLEAAVARVRPDETEEETLTDVGGALEFDVPITGPQGPPGSAAQEFEALLTQHSQATQTLDLPPLATPAPLPQIERGAVAPPEAEPGWEAAPAARAPEADRLSAFLGEEISRPAEADPARAAVRRRLARNRARVQGAEPWPERHQPAVDGAVGALLAAEDPDSRFEAACTLGRAYEAVGAAAPAVRAWKEALGWRAGAAEPEARLEALYRETGALLPLAQLLAGQAHRTADPARRRAVLLEVARIHADGLQDPAAAVEHLREALAAGPPDAALAGELAGHLRATKRWPEYLEALAAAGRTAPDPADPEWTLEVGRVHLYERRDAAAALPYVVAAARALPDRVDVAADVAEARAELGQVDAAVALLEQCLAGLVGRGWADQRATLAQRLARLLERPGGDRDRARQAWRAAIEDGVRDPAVLDRCERLATQAHDWDTLAVVLRAALGEAEARRAPPAEQRELAVRLGHVLHRRLERPRDAAHAYAQGYRLDPTDDQVFRAARGLAERLALTEVQVPLYRTWLAQAAPDAPERLGVGLALVTALEESEALDDAVDEVEALAVDFPGVPAVANARERVLRAAGRWDTLVQLYRMGVAEAPDDEARADRLQRLAHAEEVGLRDLAAATATWRQALALAPENRRALAALARLLEAQKAWPALLEVSEAQLAVTPEPRRRAQVLFRMGSLLETQLGDVPAAQARYREAVAADPRCFPALHGLRDLAARAEDWPAVIENLRAELGLWDDPKERAAVLARIGEIEDRRRGDKAAALASYREALATWPESVPAARYLADRAFTEGRFADAAPLFQLLCNQKLDKWPRAARADLFCKRGVTACRLGRSREAMEALKIALEFEPTHLGALEGLVDAAGEPPLDEDLVAVDGALRAAREATDAPEALAHLARLTGRALERRFDRAGAAEAYARAAAARPDDLAMLSPLVDLHVTWRDWAQAAAALRAFSDRQAPAAVEDVAARARCVEALMREGALWTDLAGEPARGAACFKRVRVLAPDRLDAAQRQAECHVLQGDFLEARKLMRAVLAPTGAIAPADHAQALFYLGRIEALGFGDEAEADRQYRRALDVDPQHAGALLALLKGLDARGDHAGLAAALARGRARVEAVPEGPAAAALRTFAAGLRLREDDLSGARGLLDPMARGQGPGFRAARFALVQVHERAGDPRAALRPLLTLLDDDVTDIDALQTLADLLARQGDVERRLQALGVLGLFRALDPDAKAELDELSRQARKRRERPAALGDDVLAHQVVHPSFNSPLVRLAGLCSPQLAQRFDPGPAPDLSGATAVTGRRHPFSFRLRTLQALLGVDRFRLYFAPDYGEPVGVWPQDPPLVVLGRPALEAPVAEQVGHVARALFYVRTGLAGLFNLGYRRRLALFGTLDALFVPGAAEMDAAQALVDAVPEAVAAEIKRVVDATGRMTLPTAFTGEAVMAGVSASADRASLLAGGDLRAAAEGLLRTALGDQDVPEGDDLTWAVRSAPRLRDLVKYALSEGYGQARRACDLAITGD